MQRHYSMTTSDEDIAFEVIMKDIVFNKADTMLEFANAVNIKPTSGLDYSFFINEDTKIDPQEVAEGSRADFKNMTYFTKSGTLKKYQTALMFTDETVARQIGDIQVSSSIQKTAEGLAFQKDYNIATALSNGAANTGAASAYWTDAVDADPAQDIATAIGDIMDNTTASQSQVKDIGLYYPAKLLGFMSKPIQIGEIQQSIRAWMRDEFGIFAYPTRQLTTTALVVMKSDSSAMHLVHDGSKFKGAEEWREPGVGDGYLFTQLFDTVVMPYASGETTSYYISKITGVTT